ncbi:MAG: hypothetical protein U0169_02400 [Polyangiaceae bacterium]
MKLGILPSSLVLVATGSLSLVTGCGALSSLQAQSNAAIAKANEAQAIAADPQAALKAKAGEQLAAATPKEVGAITGAANDPQSAARAKASDPVPTTVEIKNECTKSVPVFYGEKPKFGSGTKSTLGGNSINSIGRGADGSLVVWITDKNENGLVKANVTKETKRVVVASDCKAIHAE